jgi:hypothetical protein
MTRRCALPVVAALFFILFNPAPGHSCSCVAGIPICETFWKSSAVFAGEVMDIASVADVERQPFADRRVRFKVERAWRGNVSDTVDVMTGGGGGDCGYSFRRGERYLVFTYDRGGVLWTGICSPTKRLASAKEELEYLNQPFSAVAGGRIFGEVVYAPRRPGDTLRPAADYTVTLRSGERRWMARTNGQGQYEFIGIPAGTYEIAVTLQPTEHAFGPQKVELADARGCATANLTVERSAVGVSSRKLVGQVLWPDGRPAAGASVHAQFADGPPVGATTKSDAEGRFEFVVHDGKIYRLIVAVSEVGPDRTQWSVVSGDIAVMGDVDPIRLVLQPPRR